MATFTYRIIVDTNGSNAQVIRDPPFNVLHVGNQDKIQFLSNDEKTVIRYRATSPLEEGELGPQKIFDIGNSAKGPFQVRNSDGPGGRRTHHFDCGFRNPAAGGRFAPWGGTQGDDTPVDP